MNYTSKDLIRNALFMLLFMTPFLMYSQGSISGTVVDGDTNEPLIGVSILIKGAQEGTTTDFDGNFKLEDLAAGDYDVVFSYTGYSSSTLSATVGRGDTPLAVSLYGSATELEMIVVTGTGGPIEKKKIGNTIGTISTAKLADLPVNSFSDILQGREPGMVAFSSGGLTGEGAQIRIRGNASLSQLNEPIIIVDGVRVDRGGGFGGGFAGTAGGGSTSRLDDINPEAIERIEILKGASAATLFGTEASNGVIQIFTKKGKTGAPKFDFKIAQGVITFPKGKIAPNTGFATTEDIAPNGRPGSNQLSAFYGETIRPYQLISRNFTEELFETGLSTQLSAGVSGGTELFNYYVSGRYSDTDGPFGGKDRNYPEGIETRANDLDRLAQLNLNLDIKPTEKFFIRLTSGFTDRFSTTMMNNNSVIGVGSLAQFSKPEFATEQNQTGTFAFATVDETLQLTIESDVKHYNGSVGLNYYPTEWLKIDATFGLDYSNQSGEEFWPFRWAINNFSGYSPDGYKAVNSRKFVAQSGELKASINNKFGNIDSDFIIGGQIVKQETVIYSSSGENFPGPGFEVTGAASDYNVYEFFSEVVNAGVFVQEQLGFGDALFATLGARMDAHSAFGSNFNAQVYPKISLSYVPTDANWWTGSDVINTLQIRGSYGWAGLQPGAFDALTTYDALASATGAGIVPQNLGNSDLSPEISKEWEAGFSMGMLRNRLNVEFTYWDRKVTDALYSRQFAPSGGFRNSQLVNIGALEAKGIEIGVNGTVYRNKNLKVDLYANAAYILEQITDLGGAPPLKVGGSYPRYRNFLIEGFAPGANFGAATIDVTGDQLPIDIANNDGQPDTKAELIAYFTENATGTFSPPTTVGTGGVLLRDDDGDGDLLDHYLGKSSPDWTGAFGGSVSWKNFTLNTTFEYKAGNYVVNNLTDAFRQANGAIGRNLPRSARVVRDYVTGGVDGSYTPQNDPNVRVEALEEWLYETLALAPFSGLNTLEKADFIRWRELSIVYRFPKSMIEGIGFSNLSFGVSGRNLAIFTGYTGVDPEINFVGRGSGGNLDQNFGQGIAAFGWPIPRQVLFTLKFGF